MIVRLLTKRFFPSFSRSLSFFDLEPLILFTQNHIENTSIFFIDECNENHLSVTHSAKASTKRNDIIDLMCNAICIVHRPPSIIHSAGVCNSFAQLTTNNKAREKLKHFSFNALTQKRAATLIRRFCFVYKPKQREKNCEQLF